MTEYKGFKYMQYPNGKFILVLPSGLKSVVDGPELEIRKQIDRLVKYAKDQKVAS